MEKLSPPSSRSPTRKTTQILPASRRTPWALPGGGPDSHPGISHRVSLAAYGRRASLGHFLRTRPRLSHPLSPKATEELDKGNDGPGRFDHPRRTRSRPLRSSDGLHWNPSSPLPSNPKSYMRRTRWILIASILILSGQRSPSQAVHHLPDRSPNHCPRPLPTTQILPGSPRTQRVLPVAHLNSHSRISHRVSLAADGRRASYGYIPLYRHKQ